MAVDLQIIYERLYSVCEQEDFAGHDPFDGLNSRLYQMSPLKHFAVTRLAWLQMLKRFPVDLRDVLQVEKGVNPKGLALFALAEMSRFRTTDDEQHLANAKKLIQRLLETKISGKTRSGEPTTAFGYNFNWQSRNFYAPRGTPAIVPTAFASQALIEAHELFPMEGYLDVAREICSFIIDALNRIEGDDEVCFSYTPNDKTVIYNASLLAAECLARIGMIDENSVFTDLAAKAVRFVIRRQRSDGAWVYGEGEKQGWVDNFHTAYVLLSLDRISTLIPELQNETKLPLELGIQYWLDNFFLDDGTPKYFDRETYPIDIHSAAVAIAALGELKLHNERMLPLAQKVADWAVRNMLDDSGLFYYQIRKLRSVKTPFMRWGQAWMAYALARLIEAKTNERG